MVRKPPSQLILEYAQRDEYATARALKLPARTITLEDHPEKLVCGILAMLDAMEERYQKLIKALDDDII